MSGVVRASDTLFPGHQARSVLIRVPHRRQYCQSGVVSGGWFRLVLREGDRGLLTESRLLTQRRAILRDLQPPQQLGKGHLWAEKAEAPILGSFYHGF